MKSTKIALPLITCILAVVYFLPVIFMIIGSFKPDQTIFTQIATLDGWLPTNTSWQNYHDVFARTDFLGFMWNSMVITLCVVAGGLVVNSMAGYALSRWQWRGQKTVLTILLAMLIIPVEAIAVPMFFLVTQLGWRDTLFVQIVPFIANAFSIYLFYTFFKQLPKELEEAAFCDGAGPMRTFFHIIVPLSKPAFASVAILTFLTQWSSFLWPLLVTSNESVRPLSLAIAEFYTLPPLQWGDIFAFGTMMVLPVLVFFIVLQRWFVEGIATTGIKGYRHIASQSVELIYNTTNRFSFWGPKC